ncbi:peptidyl-alpha-hydroxyglycine alpha-amidating lyase family protein [Rugosimonospora acidiphila]|uniref:Peptidyl-alpha-hydroxyglycine alpha-amidating lyase family protein n=1 Tax=Rugosimonospora acidiphila TaxID=556531 RepID=A0ABP9SMX0_9ACTN
MVILGSGQFRYRVETQWAQLPEGWTLGDVPGVGVDSRDRVYVFSRGPNPVAVFDRDGAFHGSWGGDVFTHPHGVHITPDDLLYLTDDGDHTVRRCTADGRVLLQIGDAGNPAPFMSGRPFRRCTHTALAPDGDIWVSDGYQNARVHRYSPDGELRWSFGDCGAGPGEFNLPHALHCDADGMVYVADRENHRVQIFDDAGMFVTEWRNLHRPSSIVPLPGEPKAWLIGEIGPVMRFNRGAHNLGPRLSIVDEHGRLITRLCISPSAGLEPGQFLSPHGIAVDSHGDIYVAQVGATAWPQLFPGQDAPAHFPSLQKLVRID